MIGVLATMTFAAIALLLATRTLMRDLRRHAKLVSAEGLEPST